MLLNSFQLLTGSTSWILFDGIFISRRILISNQEDFHQLLVQKSLDAKDDLSSLNFGKASTSYITIFNKKYYSTIGFDLFSGIFDLYIGPIQRLYLSNDWLRRWGFFTESVTLNFSLKKQNLSQQILYIAPWVTKKVCFRGEQLWQLLALF